jgi:hypothetical protein
MHTRGKAASEDEGEKSDGPPAKGRKPLRKLMLKRPAPASPETAKPKTNTKSIWARRPVIGWEFSRKQIMCRSGRGGQNSSHKITFKKAGSPKKAWEQAEKWLADMLIEYEASDRQICGRTFCRGFCGLCSQRFAG